MHESGSERLLAYLPRVVYVQFSGAIWQVHPGLRQGVFPLKAVTREWELNKATKTKVSRKGFTLVPDFACTGFLMWERNYFRDLLWTCKSILHRIPGLANFPIFRSYSDARSYNSFSHKNKPPRKCFRQFLLKGYREPSSRQREVQGFNPPLDIDQAS